MVRFGYTILYVNDIQQSVDFYSKVFGFELKFITPENDYAELNSGNTTLSFAMHTLAESNFKAEYEKTTPQSKAPAFELGMVTDDVDLVLRNALEHGAILVAEPTQKPWGQIVCYIRDIEGFLVEICTSMA